MTGQHVLLLNWDFLTITILHCVLNCERFVVEKWLSWNHEHKNTIEWLPQTNYDSNGYGMDKKFQLSKKRWTNFEKKNLGGKFSSFTPETFL